jgi:hypothetical protein
MSLVSFRLSLLLMMLVAGDVAVNAQTVVDPRNAQFNASPDHSATSPDGSPALDHYELEFYMVGASQPFQTVGLGKPAPDGAGSILVDFSTLLVPVPAGGIVYSATVAAVGPGGRTSSALSIDSFEFSTPCTYTISPTTIALTSAGGTGSVTVTAPGGCAWTASESASWLSITGGASGSGNGTVAYSATANASSSAQNTTMTVAGQAVAVTEAGAACTLSVSPTTIVLGSGGGTGSVTVSVPGGCAWTATSNASWFVVTSGASASGNGSVTYSATVNPSTTDRNATLTIGGQAITVTEAKRLAAPTGLRVVRQ